MLQIALAYACLDLPVAQARHSLALDPPHYDAAAAELPANACTPNTHITHAYHNTTPTHTQTRRLDIRSPSIRPIMTQRLQNCKDKGFVAVDPDNMDGYSNDRCARRVVTVSG